MTIVWFESYCLLLLASLFLTGHLIIQRSLVLIWILISGLLWFQSGRTRGTLKQMIQTGLFVQLPGIAAAAASLVEVSMNSTDEWMNGVLEFWNQPFVPLLELLPAARLGNLSDVYIAAVCTPFMIVAMSAIFWRMGGRVSNRKRDNEFNRAYRLRDE